MKLRRKISQYQGGDPSAMSKMSEGAIFSAFDDAKHDILALHEQNAALLAALEAGYSDLRGRLIQYAQTAFITSYDEAAKHADTGVPVLEQMRAAIAKAKGEKGEK